MKKFSIIKGVLAGLFGIAALGAANSVTDRVLYGDEYKTLINDAAVKAGQTCGMGKETRQNNIYEAVYQNPGLKNPFRYFSWKTYLPFSESFKYLEILPRGNTAEVLAAAKKHDITLYPARFAESWFNLPAGVEAVLYNEEGKRPVLVYSDIKSGQMEKVMEKIAQTGGLKQGAYIVYHNPNSDALETTFLAPGENKFAINDGMTTTQIGANPCYTGGLGMVTDAAGRTVGTVRDAIAEKAGNAKDAVVDGVSGAAKGTGGWFKQKWHDYTPW